MICNDPSSKDCATTVDGADLDLIDGDTLVLDLRICFHELIVVWLQVKTGKMDKITGCKSLIPWNKFLEICFLIIMIIES